MSKRSTPFSILCFPPVKTTIPTCSDSIIGIFTYIFFGKVLNKSSTHHRKPANNENIKKLNIFLKLIKKSILKKLNKYVVRKIRKIDEKIITKVNNNKKFETNKSEKYVTLKKLKLEPSIFINKMLIKKMKIKPSNEPGKIF